MRLSRGAVVGDRLQCRYHGWTFGADGRGESPGTPKLHACAEYLDARDAHGAVWVKTRGSRHAFPQFEVGGYLPICRLRHQICSTTCSE
jgi:phenylpropionate dioxygenase-like ring-hydroxylating dioxygenase large terminal subunit